MPQDNPSSSSLRKLLLSAGLAAGLILAALTIISLTRTVKEKEKVDQIPVDASLSGQLVSGFPQMPVYPGAILLSSSRKDERTEFEYRATWKTSQFVPQVMAWYFNELEKADWLIEIQPADPQAEAVQFLMAKKQDLTLNLSVIREDETAATRIVAEFPPLTREDKN